MPITEATYRQVAEEAFPEVQWELVCGQLREKPGMTMRHNIFGHELVFELMKRIGDAPYRVAFSSARLRLLSGDHYVPDVVVIPLTELAGRWDESGVEAYRDPVPLVVEIRSPSTGVYDATAKLTGYRERGDHEIWLVDVGSQSIRAWVLQPSSEYAERRYARGKVPVTSLPGVTIDFDAILRRVHL